MDIVKFRRRQSLVDLSVQEYGSQWMDGLISIQRNNLYSLSSPPESGGDIKLVDVDDTDPLLIEFKRDAVKVTTVVNSIEVSLLPPTNLEINQINSTSISLNAISNSLGKEDSFEWQLSNDYDFSSILESSIQPSGDINLSIEFNELSYLTDYFFRVRANGGDSNDWSEVLSASTIINGRIFESLEHAHFRGDSFIDINGESAPIALGDTETIIRALDLSPNGRHIGDELVANEYAFASSSGNRSLDGHPCICFDSSVNSITPRPHLTNNTNWAGLSDNYTVIMVVNLNWIGNNYRRYFGRNNAIDTGSSIAHAYSNGSSASQRQIILQNGYTGKDVITASILGVTETTYECVMIKYSSSGIRVWINGIEESITSDIGTLLESFDSIILGNNRDLGLNNRLINIWDLFFINDIPENQPQKIKDWHTQYLKNRYPSLNIVNPII